MFRIPLAWTKKLRDAVLQSVVRASQSDGSAALARGQSLQRTWEDALSAKARHVTSSNMGHHQRCVRSVNCTEILTLAILSLTELTP